MARRIIVTDNEADFGPPPEQAAAEPSARDRLMALASKEGPAIAGTMMGAAVGGIPGAGIGAMGGKAIGRVGEYLTGSRDPASDTAMGNAGEIARAGLEGLTGETAIKGIGLGLQAIRPAASKVGAGLIKVASSVPEKYGEAALKDLSMLGRAKTTKAMGAAYQDFEKRTGLRGLEAQLVSEGRATAGSSRLEKMVIGTANKVAAGKNVKPQELYLASQAASRLKLGAKFGEPQAQMASESAAVKQGKSIVDTALEKIYPEYKKLRIDNFEAKAREAFGHLLPQNKNLSVNVLRPTAVAAGVASGAVSPAALLALSPAAHGAGIRTAAKLSPAAKLLSKLGVRTAAQTISDEDDDGK